MPLITKRSPKIHFEFVPAKQQSVLGGLPAIEALAQRFGLWPKIRALPGIDPRVRTTHRYSPELNVAQLLYCFCSGGAGLADAERLNDEPLVRPLARVPRFADQTQLGEWLHITTWNPHFATPVSSWSQQRVFPTQTGRR